MNNNFRKKRCFQIYKETKDIGFVLLVFGAVTICAFFLPPKAWLILLGVILIVAGIILHNRGKKTESEQLKKLEAIRRDKLDALLHEIHGAVPGKTIEPQE